jgi:mannose-6-phosphate isomerase-like protein (cupin superfamily)
MAGVVHRQGEGELIPGPSSVTIKATGQDTGGSFYLGEAVIQPGFPGPPPHVHERLHDMFYVLEGTLTVRLGDETVELGPGSFACIPPGTVHTFSNPSEQAVRFLNFNTPAGWEDYMRDLAAALAAGSPTPEEIGRIASRYDFRAV